MDAQDRAFRESTEADWIEADTLGPVPATEEIRPPEAFEGWDAERQDPKNLSQARHALAARVADDAAPDDDAHAYDDLGPVTT